MDKITLVSNNDYNPNKRLKIEGNWETYEDMTNLFRVIAEFFTCNADDVMEEGRPCREVFDEIKAELKENDNE